MSLFPRDRKLCQLFFSWENTHTKTEERDRRRGRERWKKIKFCLFVPTDSSQSRVLCCSSLLGNSSRDSLVLLLWWKETMYWHTHASTRAHTHPLKCPWAAQWFHQHKALNYVWGPHILTTNSFCISPVTLHTLQPCLPDFPWTPVSPVSSVSLCHLRIMWNSLCEENTESTLNVNVISMKIVFYWSLRKCDLWGAALWIWSHIIYLQVWLISIH